MASAERHRALVERLEVEARRSPGAYRIKVALLAALGFVVLGGALLLALGISAGLVIALIAVSPLLLLKLAKIVWIPIGFGWLVLKSLWVKFAPPDGHRLADDEAPALRADIERLRVATAAPALAGIVIDADLNAAAASVPRAMGLLGHRHYLVLGLPLMQLLDRDQFASVVAHEFGHFGGGHGRFSGWIYRVRTSWYRLLEALSAQRSWATGAFARFFDWYAPYFNAYSFVLARGNEYQADAAAARVVGAQAAAQALIRVNVGSARLSRDFWPDIQRATQRQPAPPALLYRDMADSLRRAHADDGERLSQTLSLTSDFDDTHPTLAQRLAALGVPIGEVAPPERSAAEELLGDLLPRLEQRFSDEWRSGVETTWQQNFRQHAIDLDRLGELEGQDTRSPDERVEHARLVEDLHPDVDALPLYRRAVEHAPEHPYAHFRLGTLLLDRGDDGGIAHLRRAMDLDPDAVEPGLHRLDQHYRQAGDGAARDAIMVDLDALYAARAKANRARADLTARDVFVPHGLDDDALRALDAALDAVGKIRRAWLVRKTIPDDPSGPPHHLLLVAWRGAILSEDKALQRIADALALPGTFVVFTASHRRGIARRIRKAAAAPIYRKGWW